MRSLARSSRRATFAGPFAAANAVHPRAGRIAAAHRTEAPGDSVAYHPVTLARDTVREADALFEALENLPNQILFCYPNADAGSRNLIERARSFASFARRGACVRNLERANLWSFAEAGGCAGGKFEQRIMRVSFFPRPHVNVGLRQQVEERARNVIDARRRLPPSSSQSRRQKSTDFREGFQGMTNPYGEGLACEKIVEVLPRSARRGIAAETHAPPRAFTNSAGKLRRLRHRRAWRARLRRVGGFVDEGYRRAVWFRLRNLLLRLFHFASACVFVSHAT